MCARFYSTDELNVLLIFVDYLQTIHAQESIQSMRLFSKTVPAPKSLFPANSLGIAVRKQDLETILETLQNKGINPLKCLESDQCVLSHFFQTL